jgi:hypothetical protein
MKNDGLVMYRFNSRPPRLTEIPSRPQWLPRREIQAEEGDRFPHRIPLLTDKSAAGCGVETPNIPLRRKFPGRSEPPSFEQTREVHAAFSSRSVSRKSLNKITRDERNFNRKRVFVEIPIFHLHVL